MNIKERMFALLKSKTVWGAVFAAVGWLLKQPQITAPEVITALGTILSACGVRDSFTKYLGSIPGTE